MQQLDGTLCDMWQRMFMMSLKSAATLPFGLALSSPKFIILSSTSSLFEEVQLASMSAAMSAGGLSG